MTPAKVAGADEISRRNMKIMIEAPPSESAAARHIPPSGKDFTTRLLRTLLQYGVFAAVGMLTVLAVLWRQAQPADVGALRNTLVSVLSDVLMVPAFIIALALSKALLKWMGDHWHYETLDRRLASRRRLQDDLLLSGLTAFATWLTFLTTGDDQHQPVRRRAVR